MTMKGVFAETILRINTVREIACQAFAFPAQLLGYVRNYIGAINILLQLRQTVHSGIQFERWQSHIVKQFRKHI